MFYPLLVSLSGGMCFFVSNSAYVTFCYLTMKRQFVFSFVQKLPFFFYFLLLHTSIFSVIFVFHLFVVLRSVFTTLFCSWRLCVSQASVFPACLLNNVFYLSVYCVILSVLSFHISMFSFSTHCDTFSFFIPSVLVSSSTTKPFLHSTMTQTLYSIPRRKSTLLNLQRDVTRQDNFLRLNQHPSLLL